MRNYKQVIILNGAKGSGKDTFVRACICAVGDYGSSKKVGLQKLWPTMVYVHNLSTIERIKEVGNDLGWNGVKDEKSRKFLSDLKDAWSGYNNGPENFCIEEVVRAPNRPSAFFIHCREPDNIDYLKKRFEELGISVTSMVIRNEKAEAEGVSNHADEHVLDYAYNFSIDNNGSLEDLIISAEKYIFSIGGGVMHSQHRGDKGGV